MAREQFEADSAGTHGEALSAASECGPSSSPSVGEDFHIVAIGASAGGLESLERLFAHLPTDTGMAFVVLQHLSPDFKSLMDELLSRRTAMPIRQAEHDMAVEPDTVYLLPPMKEMIIRQRTAAPERSRSAARPCAADRSISSARWRRTPASAASRSSCPAAAATVSRGIQDDQPAGGMVFC